MSEPIQVVDLRGRTLTRSSKRNSLKKPRPTTDSSHSHSHSQAPENSSSRRSSSASRTHRTSNASSNIPPSILRSVPPTTAPTTAPGSRRSSANYSTINVGGGNYITTKGGGAYVSNPKGGQRGGDVDIRMTNGNGATVRQVNVPSRGTTGNGNGNAQPQRRSSSTTRDRRASNASGSATAPPMVRTSSVTRGRTTTTTQTQTIAPNVTVVTRAESRPRRASNASGTAPLMVRTASMNRNRASLPAGVNTVPFREAPRRSSSTTRPRRTSNASNAHSHPPVTKPVHTTYNVVAQTRARTNSLGSGKPKEQVLYIPSDQPIVILDERRNKNAPLPTIIRDGKVIMGGRGAMNVDRQNVAIVRSDRGGSPSPPLQESEIPQTYPHNNFTAFKTVRDDGPLGHQSPSHNRNSSRTRRSSSASPPQGRRSKTPERRSGGGEEKYADAGGVKLERKQSWGHANPREPPWGHPDHRCYPSWRGFKNWFLGTAMLDKHKKARGNAEAEEAQRERESEKARREREYRHNVRAWKGGRTDVHLW